MKMVPNDDVYMKQFVKEGWASTGFLFTDSFDSSVESTEGFGANKTQIFNYTKKNTYYNNGGYLISFNISNETSDDVLERVL